MCDREDDMFVVCVDCHVPASGLQMEMSSNLASKKSVLFSEMNVFVQITTENNEIFDVYR